MKVSQSQWRLFLFELKLFSKASLLLKPWGKFCFVEKVQAKIYALFKAWRILIFPLVSFNLKLGVLVMKSCTQEFLMTTFRKMRGHFLHSNIHENTDVSLPPQLQTLWLSYFLSAISAKVFQEEHRVKKMSAISILRSFRLYLMCSISLKLVLAC